MTYRFSRVAAVAGSFALGSLLAGCSGALNSTPTTSQAVSVSGNWQIAASVATAHALTGLSGELTGTSTSFTGLLHPIAGTTCLPLTTVFPVSGSANAQGILTLTSAGVDGGTLTISGTLASDGKSLSNATYNMVGGSCSLTSPVSAKAQVYSPVSGTYTGSFADPDGQVITVTANLSQNPNANTQGDFQLSGTGTFPQNPCFVSPVTVTNSQVTGGSFTLTYTDATTANSVTATGTFSTDGSTLTVSQWTLTGSCGPDSGTGLLTRQQPV